MPWLDERCSKTELKRKDDTFNTHEKRKEAAGIYKQKISIIITDNDGQILPNNTEDTEYVLFRKY